MKVRELLSDESKWTKHDYARDKYGIGIGMLSTDAVCWCLSGAIYKCYGKDGVNDIKNKVYEKLGLHMAGIPEWNDDSDRTFEEVKTLVEELDI